MEQNEYFIRKSKTNKKGFQLNLARHIHSRLDDRIDANAVVFFVDIKEPQQKVCETNRYSKQNGKDFRRAQAEKHGND